MAASRSILMLESLDWEPARIAFSFRGPPVSRADDVRARCTEWFAGPRASCSCGLAFLKVEEAGAMTVEVLVQWVCRHCLQAFCDFVAGGVRDVDLIVCGFPDDPPAGATPAPRFISIPSQEVELEDGRITPVESFSVTTRPVTVAMFEDFAGRTGYQTTAEQAGSDETFARHSLLSGLSRRERSGAAAEHLSYVDSLAYCAWSGTRLPTEAEWLAVAVGTRPSLPRGAEPFYFDSEEWTSSVDGGLQVVRHGPTWKKSPNWKEQRRQNRFLVERRETAGMRGFRVVR